MITIGTTKEFSDRIKYSDNNELVYLGNVDGEAQTEFNIDQKEYFFFDTNNIRKIKNQSKQTVNQVDCARNVSDQEVIWTFDKIDSTDIGETEAFMSNARFYYCKANNSNGFCFRCTGCQTCDNCQQECYGCNKCVDCTVCNGCQLCTGCQTCDDCQRCNSTCTNCQGSCNGCNSCNGCVKCTSCVSGVDGGCDKCYSGCAGCVSCRTCYTATN